jgi:TatD-related deoxyribonuclease
MIANPEEIPITDTHIHVDPYNGKGPVKIAEIFHNNGGRVMIIPNKPAWNCGEPYNYEKGMDLNIKYVKTINKETSVRAYSFLGVHPAEYSNLIRAGKSYEEAYSRVIKAINYGAKLVSESESLGIGEIGRPHYPVEPEELKYHNKILEHCLKLGKDLNCPVMLHTEDFTPKEYEEIGILADKIGISKNKIIKHHAGPCVLKEENYGLMPSITTNKTNIIEALSKNTRFFMETDFFDEDAHPGMVLGPKTVPKRTLNFINNGKMSVDEAFKIHKDNVEKVFDIDQN